MQSLVLISRDDVIKDPSVKHGQGKVMALWIEQELIRKNIPRWKGCSLAIKEFGNNNPFSDQKIYKLKSLDQFKDIKYQNFVMNRKPVDKTKDKVIKRISKEKKEILLAVEEIISNPSEPMHQVLYQMARRF